MRRTILHTCVDAACLALCLGVTILLAVKWGGLPERIPMHYDGHGRVNAYGGKCIALVLPALMWGLFVLMSVAEVVPAFGAKIVHMPVKATEANRCRLRTIQRDMTSATKLLALAVLALPAVYVIRGGDLPVWFSPATIAAFALHALFWTLKILRNRTERPSPPKGTIGKLPRAPLCGKDGIC